MPDRGSAAANIAPPSWLGEGERRWHALWTLLEVPRARDASRRALE